MTPLCELARKYRTDKSNHHEYTPVYYALLNPVKDTTRRVLEIGIGDEGYQYNGWGIGASVRMWRDFFPNADLFGFDIKPVPLGDRIRTVWADQDKPYTIRQAALDVGGRFDLIVDDGSHVTEHQISSANVLLPFLSEKGVYIIEDVGPNAAVVAAGINPGPFYIEVLPCSSPVLGMEEVVVIRRVP